MEKRYYDTAVLGASFMGLGVAMQTENTIVIEKGGTFGSEFVNSFRVCKPGIQLPSTEMGRAFWQELKSRGLISEEGDIHAGPTVYVLSKYLMEKQTDILLMTEVTDIKKVDGYFQITLYHAGGFEEILAGNILNTTAFGIGQKYLNAIVYNPKHCKSEGISYNTANNLYTYSLSVEQSTSRAEAIEMLCEREEAFKEMEISIASIASDFAYDVPQCRKEVEEHFTWIPSAGYGNLLEAFDAGIAYAKENRTKISETTVLRQIRNNKVEMIPMMPSFTEKYDLIVAGLGTAGAISLIAAAREGISVLGVEQMYCMGGTGTIGNILGYYFGAEGGLYTEFDEKAKALQDTVFWRKNRRDTKAFVYEREALASGAAIKYHCTVVGVFMQENRVIGLRLLQNGKTMDVAADKIIDATGEAIVCHMAGCDSLYSREFDNQAQPTTSSAVIIYEDCTTGSTNRDAGFVNPSDPRAVSRTILRSNTFPMYLKEDYRKEENKFIATAPLFGVREGRRIKGRKILSLSGVLQPAADQSKPLFYAFSNVDNHGKDRVFENEEFCDWMVACGLWGVLMSVPVPMEALIPEGIENIMVAGRCLSADHNLAPCVRMKRDMAKSGEAAAYVCAAAIRRKVGLSEVTYEEIEKKLKDTKCLDESNHVGFRERVQGSYLGNELPKLSTAEDIVGQLATDKPGWAIYAAKNYQPKNELAALLISKLESEDENLARNAALALGLMGDLACACKLRQMAAEPDNYIPKSSLKYVDIRGVSAIYLLGKLGDQASIPALFKILEHKGRTQLTNFTFGEFYCESTDVYSQYILFSVRALLEIAQQYQEQKEEIIQRIKEILAPSDYTIFISLKQNTSSLHDMKPKLLQYVERMEHLNL